ncbi:MAG: restriction endonuclease subunit S [Burkholderiales bacterium]|jgi:type I restriction enzyme S subunit|nr:restriction endonuclease subunit S [Burkholderiales bacterium]
MKYAAYGSYEPSKSVWFDQLPSHWQQLRVKHVIERMESGVSVNSDASPASNEEIGVLKTGCVYGDQFSPQENKRVLDEEIERVACPVKANRLIISRMNTPELVGSCGYVDHDFPNLYLPDRLWQAVFSKSRKCSPKFAWYYLTSRPAKSAISSLAAGTSASMQNIAQDAFVGIGFPLPPLDEQQTIARFLDAKTAQIDELIAKKRLLIDKLKEKRQALIARTVTRGLPPEAAKAAGLEPNPEMKTLLSGWADECPVHWQTWKISHGFGLTGSGTTPPSDNEEWYEGDIPWVTTGELRETIITDTSKKVSRAAIKEFSALKIFPAGSLAIAMYGATIGRLGIFGVAATTNQACCVLAKERAFERDFVFYWLQAFRDQIVMLATGGGQPNISQEKIRSLRIPCPSVHEQRIISKYLREESEKIDQLVDAAESAIERVNEFRQAVITSAVTGKIDVRGVA